MDGWMDGQLDEWPNSPVNLESAIPLSDVHILPYLFVFMECGPDHEVTARSHVRHCVQGARSA